MAVAIADAFRNIRVVQPSVPESTITTVAAEVVGDTLSITAGLGITITADPETDTLVISNTGNGTGAYTEISDTNSNSTFYPLFSRPFEPTDINPLDTPPSYQLDAIYVDNTANPMTYNPSSGTLTAVAFVGNLTGDVTGNVSGNSGTVTNGVYTNGSYSDPSWLTISQTKVGLGNVTNESKATMFTSPTFTGHPTIEGVTSTGATGTGKFVFDNAPTISGHPTIEGVTSTGATGTGKFVFDTTPTVSGGSITALTTFGLRDTTAAFDVRLAATSTSATLTANRTITFDVGDAARTVKLNGNLSLGGTLTTENQFTVSGAYTATLTAAGVFNATFPAGTYTLPANNQTFYIGTTAVTIDRTSASLALTGVSIDGNAGTVTNGVYTSGSYSDPSWLTISSSKVGLGNVENTALSTSTHYIGTTSIQYNRASASQTLSGVSVDGNAGTVTDGVYTSGSYSDPSWLTISSSKVGLGSVENTALSTWAGSSNITTVGTLGSLSVTNNISTVSGLFSAPLATKTSTGTGTAGQVAWDANYIYICTATNTWKRVALTAGVF